MKRWWLGVSAVTIFGLVVAALLLLAPKSVLPQTLTRQVTSTVLVPESSEVKVSRDSARYDASVKLLTFTATLNGLSIVISQQPTPETFNDVPEVYNKVIANMSEYAHFESAIGTVHLTRPKDAGGKQTAVLNTDGTLLFAKPASDMSEDQWRIFFKKLHAGS